MNIGYNSILKLIMKFNLFGTTQEGLAFHCFGKEGSLGYNPPRRELQCLGAHQCTSQVCGKMARSPRAPALAQRAASSLIFVSRSVVEGRPLLKMQSLRCFHIIHGTRWVTEARPLRMGHQSLREISRSGGVQGIIILASILVN